VPAADRVLLTCEHATAHVPARYAGCFRGAARVLRSHRGFDAGALALARHLARALGAPLVAATASRLLVDLNRSLHHPRVFSEWTRELDAAEKERLVARHHAPYRETVEQTLARWIGEGARALHLSVHSFTPRLDGVERRADVGLLYDPARARERRLCVRWQRLLEERDPGLRVRRNHPYRGDTDGLTTALRRRFPPSAYLGIELELSQAWVRRSRVAPRILRALEESARRLLRDRRDGAGSPRRRAPAGGRGMVPQCSSSTTRR
jgi:predicted N-formylglutamate amidohydrolase